MAPVEDSEMNRSLFLLVDIGYLGAETPGLLIMASRHLEGKDA